MSSSYISAELRRLVQDRARGLCEYCLLHESDTYLGNATARILDFNSQPVSVPHYLDRAGRTTSVTMDIGQTLLNHAEYCNLHLWGQALELLRYIERCLNVAPLCEAIGIPPKGRRKPHLIQQGRVKQMGSGTNFVGYLIHQRGILSD